MLYPSGDYEHNVYNGDGTLSAKAVWDDNDDKQWIDYYYDSYGRIEDVNYPDSGNIHYDYDGFGRKTLVTDNRNATDNIGGDGTISYEYDALGRVTKITDHDDWVTEYDYMSDGQKSQIKVLHPDDATVKYHVAYLYDKALRLEYVSEPLLGLSTPWIAGFGYDDNGNRDSLTYYRDGTLGGNTTAMSYAYNGDNRLTAFSTTGGVTFSLSNTTVDGLGRLIEADETLTKPDSSTISHSHDYAYDMRSQLTDASVTNIGGSTWTADYNYRKDGNIDDETVAGSSADFDYDGDLMTDKGNDSLNWDLNGQMTSGITASMEWNWDGKMQSASAGGTSIDLKYDPSGNRIYKSVDNGTVTNRKYIVDVIGRLPVILLEIDPSENDPNDAIVKTYLYATAQILAQHDGFYEDNIYFYLHDRLGSIRQMIDTSANVKDKYTYEPFGSPFTTETTETITNPWTFTGQYYDSEIEQYYLRARQYDPTVYRFASRDPYKGAFEKPGELHKYLYCVNDPINNWDLTGRVAGTIARAKDLKRVAAGAVIGGAGILALQGYYTALDATVTGYEQGYDDFLGLGDAVRSLLDSTLGLISASRAKQAQKKINGAMKVINEHLDRINNSGPGDPNKDWLKHVMKHLRNVKKYAKRLKGKAQEEALKYIDDTIEGIRDMATDHNVPLDM